MVDSHLHLTYKIFKNNIYSISPTLQIRECIKTQITRLNCIILDNYDNELKLYIKLFEKFKSQIKIHLSVGLHPEDLNRDTDKKAKQVTKFIKENVNYISAIGETGIDLHNEINNLTKQIEIFELQIEIAKQNRLPLILHTRPSEINSEDAYNKTIKILKSKNLSNPFIFHCFSSTKKIAKEILDIGGYFGIAGNITYPNSEYLRDSLKYIPINRILPETDSPFLPSQNHRGEVNYPFYVNEIAEEICKIKEIDYKSFDSLCESTFDSFFNLPK